MAECKALPPVLPLSSSSISLCIMAVCEIPSRIGLPPMDDRVELVAKGRNPSNDSVGLRLWSQVGTPIMRVHRVVI